MLTTELKADLALRLARLADKPYCKHAGICANVLFMGKMPPAERHNDYFFWLMDTARRWPQYSGGYLFPVPRLYGEDPTLKWEGSYGVRRYELLTFLLEEITKELNDATTNPGTTIEPGGTE